MYQYGDLHTTLITEILLIFLLTKKKNISQQIIKLSIY